jgi:tetratricopeptide (TPR) repeat protein
MARKLFGIGKPAEKEPAPAAVQTLQEPPGEPTPASVTPPPSSAQTNPPGAIPAPVSEPEETSRPVRPLNRPHAFVVMPFGKKKGGDGSLYDFNAIYKTMIKPALEEAGFESFRADEETASGDILTDMFQELLLADLVLADLSIDNANAYYELGIRHALRKRGVMHIQAGRAYMPFDVFNVRTLPYHITPEGVPDPAYLRADITAIARMARDTFASDRDAVHSPVFNLLTGLWEPDRKFLQTPLATGFWREYNEWKDRVTIARRQKRIGDILLLTEEIRNPLIKEEAIGEAGKALASMGRNELALSQYRKGLDVNPGNMDFRREEVRHLGRLGRVDEAIVKIEGILADHPDDSEASAYLGRIYKDMWVKSWKEIRDKSKRIKAAFDSYHWLIKSLDTYMNGYRIDLDNFYPGVNALTLSMIAVHLADKFENKKDPDPDIKRIRADLDRLRSALTFALETKMEDPRADYWTLVSMAELLVLTADHVPGVTRAYRKALTASRRNPSSIQTSIDQLEILSALGMREEFVHAAMNTLLEEFNLANKEETSTSKTKRKSGKAAEGQVFLLSGYMVDYASKEQKTFPVDKENEIRAEIRKRLENHHAGPGDIAFTAGLSAGSEMIFAEVCAGMGVTVEAHLPLPEAAYIREFINPGGDSWVERFYMIRNHPLVNERYQSEHVGEPKDGDDPYERNNRWALYSSLIQGVDKVKLIAVWNGRGGRMKDRDARLVKHMVELMRDTGGAMELINTSKYIHGFIDGAYDGLPDLSKPAAPPAIRRRKKDPVMEQRRKRM